jgi:hypothetical protein
MSRTFKITGILSLLFIFSCSDLEKISQQMETINKRDKIPVILNVLLITLILYNSFFTNKPKTNLNTLFK